MKLWLPVLTIVLLQLALAIISLGFDMPRPAAVCTTDYDCARWERANRPRSEWCYETLFSGGYCIDTPKEAK